MIETQCPGTQPNSAMVRMAAGTDSLRLTDVSRRLKAIFVGSIGNLVEWYDSYAYTAFALYFANRSSPAMTRSCRN